MFGLAAGKLTMDINVIIFYEWEYQLQLHICLLSPLAQLILVEFKVQRT
jgi:hypothetical protein